MDKNLEIFEYEGNPITFIFENNQRMVNATEIAKPFKGKFVADFLRLKQTKDFIGALNVRYGNSHNDNKYEALKVVRGGTPQLQGTWMEERLALKFAAWLSADFELFVYDTLRDLILNEKFFDWATQKIIDNAIESQNLIKSLRENRGL